LTERGRSFGGRRTLTAEDLDLAVRLTGGRHPVHVDDEAARRSGLQGRIFHGAVSAAIMTAAIGAHYAQRSIALLEQSCRYRASVHPGDEVESRWTVLDARPGRRPGQTVLALAGELRNRQGELLVEGSAKLLLLD